jgi:hypothetical protein
MQHASRRRTEAAALLRKSSDSNVSYLMHCVQRQKLAIGNTDLEFLRLAG